MSFKLEFKDDIIVNDLMFLTSNCSILFVEFMKYCQKNSLPCKISSIRSDRKNIRSVSKTHETGRAIDFSIRGWTTDDIDDCVHYFNRHYSNIAAISYSDGKPRAIVHHNFGHGDHIHIQVRPDGT